MDKIISLTDLISFSVIFVAGLLGILFGFLLNRASERDKDKQTVATFLKLIRQELSEIRKMPTNDTSRIYILYTDIWDSMVSSGILSLLKPDQVSALSSLYKHIKGTSFEAEWFRRAWEEYQSIPDFEFIKKYNYVGKKLDESGLYQLTRLTELQQHIDFVFKELGWEIPKTQATY